MVLTFSFYNKFYYKYSMIVKTTKRPYYKTFFYNIFVCSSVYPNLFSYFEFGAKRLRSKFSDEKKVFPKAGHGNKSQYW